MKEKFAVSKNYKKKKKKEYMLKEAGNYILEFKFNEKWWGLILQRKMVLWDVLLIIQKI